MSWSMLEPEEATMCECKYNEARDEMDREDCPFHCRVTDDLPQVEARSIARKEPISTAVTKQVDVA